MRIEAPGPFYRLVLSDDGHTLAGDHGGKVHLFRHGEAASPISLARHPGPIALAPDGGALFGGEKTVAVFDVETRTKCWTTKTKSGVDPVVFSKDGAMVAYREIGGPLCLVDAANGERVASASIKSVADGYFGTIVAAGISRSGLILGTVVERGKRTDLVRWRLPLLEPVDVVEVQQAVVSGRGGSAVLLRDGRYHLVDLDEPARAYAFGGVPDVMDPFVAIQIDPTGRYVGFLEDLPIDPHRPLSVWDAAANREVARLDSPEDGQAVLLGPEAAFAVCVELPDRKVALARRL